MEEVAGDWYDRVYLPALEALHREGLPGTYTDRTEADLYLWISQRRRSLYPQRGGVSFEEAAREAREDQPQVTGTLKVRRQARRARSASAGAEPPRATGTPGRAPPGPLGRGSG